MISDPGDASQGPDRELEERRAKLAKQIAAHEAEEEAQRQADARAKATASGYAQAFRLSTDFVAGVAVGAFLGFGFDWVFGTTPWLLIVFLLLGFAAGVLNVLRSAGLIQQPQVGHRPRGDECRHR